MPQLVIVSHPDSSDRPAGADPLDIRDVVDWLEPQLNLDLEKLRTEVRKRLPRSAAGARRLDDLRRATRSDAVRQPLGQDDAVVSFGVSTRSLRR